MLPLGLSAGKFSRRSREKLLTFNYQQLREMLLLRCDHDGLRRDVSRLKNTREFKRLRLTRDQREYVLDRPLFDQFIAGDMSISSLIHNRCQNQYCTREDCDLYHTCPSPLNDWANGWCQCSKERLVYVWYVENRHTQRRAWIGSSCIYHFSEHIQQCYEQFIREDENRARVLRPQVVNLIQEEEDDDLDGHMRHALIEALSIEDNSRFCRRYDDLALLMNLPKDLAGFIAPDDVAEEEVADLAVEEREAEDEAFMEYAEAEAARLEAMFPPSSSISIELFDEDDEEEDDEEEQQSPRKRPKLTEDEDILNEIAVANNDMSNGLTPEIRASATARIKELNQSHPILVRKFYVGE